jgi:glycosyltransferase involved in cell wall biosynthesis
MSPAIERSVPEISLVVVMYNMAREAPRTLYTLSAANQKNMAADRYEVIVVDNGSTPPLDPKILQQLDGNFRLIRMEHASPSPVAAINRGIAEARGKLIGVLIDGARMASPGLLSLAAKADKLADRAAILTLGFHLGSQVQMESVRQGYNQTQEDQLLAQSGWRQNGYRLFDISVFAGSSSGGWFRPISESNAIFMRKALWDELGGFDARFRTPGGGLVNLDLLARAVAAADTVVTLLGEGTFHQVHGGIATMRCKALGMRSMPNIKRYAGTHSSRRPIGRSILAKFQQTCLARSAARRNPPIRRNRRSERR